MNQKNNTLESIKDDIREELNNLKKEKTEKLNKNKNKLSKYKNSNGNLTSKEILNEYFNKIKQSSKLNISHNSILSSKNNIDNNNNSLEISEISNFNIDDLKIKNNNNNTESNKNNNLNKNYNIKTLNENENKSNKIYNNYLGSKNLQITNTSEKNIIYETFKNMLNKNKLNINNNLRNNESIEDNNKLSTARFHSNEPEINEKYLNILEKNENIEQNNKVIVEDNYLGNNKNQNNEFKLIEFKRKEEPNNIFKIVDK